MKKQFEQTDEELLREAFVANLPVTLVRRRRASIRRACRAFVAVVPGESILNHTHSTQWISAWRTELRGLAARTIKGLLCSLYAWWKWLFRQGEIDDNVLDFVACERLVAEDVPPLVLRSNLQRHIAEHLGGMRSVSDHTRESTRYGSRISTCSSIRTTGSHLRGLGSPSVRTFWVHGSGPFAQPVHAAALCRPQA